MQNKSEKISCHCGRGPAIQAVYKGKTSLLNRLDPGSMSGMTAKKAFTLIELLVVVLIIGILAAVAVPQYEKAVAKTKYTEIRALTHKIQQARIVYFLANGTWGGRTDKLGIDLPTTREDGHDGEYYDWYFKENGFICMVYENGPSMHCRRKVHGLVEISYEYYQKNWLCCGGDDFTKQICKQTTGQSKTVTMKGKTNCYFDGKGSY